MPERASRSDARTSCVLLPIDETIPIPVTTTRLINCSSDVTGTAAPARACMLNDYGDEPARNGTPGSAPAHVSAGAADLNRDLAAGGVSLGLEQADPEVLRLIDAAPIGLEPAVSDAEHE